MKIFYTVQDLQNYIDKFRADHHIAFIPTMGALHNGHLQLVRTAKAAQTDKPVLAICSIFVNPTQFGDPQDLEKYPRTLEKDAQLLETVQCDAVFAPSVEEVYPKDWITPPFDFGALATVMEGAARPGHFDGVGQVLHRLLSIVKPQSLYMGQKDYQQVAVVKNLLYQQLGWNDIALHMVPIAREASGLAMSSRNVRLSEEGKKQAANISHILFKAEVMGNAAESPIFLKDFVEREYGKVNLKPEYVEVVDALTLMPAKTWQDAPNGLAICVVVPIDGVRLLDNVVIPKG